jgi:hypothetical protein
MSDALIQLMKVTSSSSLKKAVIGLYYEMLLREQEKRELYPIDAFHPSGLLDCDRKLVLKILHWQHSNPNFGAVTLENFENGNNVHTRIQRNLIKIGIIVPRGKWRVPKRKVNGIWIDAIPKDFIPWAVEVPIKFPKWLIKGTCDGIALIDGKYYIVEIKSINDYGFTNLRGKPILKHHAQGQAYIKAAQEELGIEVAGVLFIYENKNTQIKKEIIVDKDDLYITQLGMRLVKLKKFCEKKKIPKRQYQMGSLDCRYCDMKEYCWEVIDNNGKEKIKPARKKDKRNR